MLTALVLVPAVGALVLLALPDRARSAARAIGSVASILTAAVAVAVLLGSWPGVSLERYPLVERGPSIPGLGAEWFLGSDGLRAALALVVALLGAGVTLREHRPARLATRLGLEATLLAALMALDLMLLHAAWTTAILLGSALLRSDGEEGARRSAGRLLAVGLAGIALQLVGVLLVGWRTGTLDLGVLEFSDALRGTPGLGALALVGLVAGFVLPLAVLGRHASSRPLLAAGFLPVGAFGVLRVALPVVPGGSEAVGPVLVVAGVAGLLLGGATAVRDADLRRVLSGGARAHAGLLLLAAGAAGTGASRHLVPAALALGAAGLAVRALISRAGHADAHRLGGLLRTRPWLGGMLGLALLAVAGVPGLATFASGSVALGESTVAYAVASLIGAAGAVLLAAGVVRAGRAALLGPPREPPLFADLRPAEAAPLALLLVPVVVFGLWPGVLPGSLLERLLGGG